MTPRVDVHRRVFSLRSVAALSIAWSLTVFGLTAPATAAPVSHDQSGAGAVDLRMLAFNDFHGNLEPPSGSSGRVTQADGSVVDAGGAKYLAAYINQLRSQAKNSLLYTGGDNIGASPLPSALFHDEPSIDFLNRLGVAASALGNHELDEGYQELLRMQRGGCHPTDGCQFRPAFDGAKFPILAANMTFDNGLPATLPFSVNMVEGVPVGVIGVPLRELPTVVAAGSVAGLRFGDEVEAINRTADLLDFFGVRSIAVLLHKGDIAEPGGPNSCGVTAGPARTIAEAASPKVDVIFTAHSHQQYNCTVRDPAGQPRVMIQGLSYGRIVSVVDLVIDRNTRDVIRDRVSSFNQVVTRDITPEPAADDLVHESVTKAAPIANRPVGAVSADVTRAPGPSGETPLGNLIADAQLGSAGAQGAQIALTNPGGVRADLSFASTGAGEGGGAVTYGEAFATQPFGNVLQTLSLTGSQLEDVLEQQFQPQPDGTVRQITLQPSANLRYSISASAPVGAKVAGLQINGANVDPAGVYRVAVNNFLADGGDGFRGFTVGIDRVGGAVDLDALTAYLGARSPIAPPATDRITPVP